MAVPVRAELALALDDLAHRQKQCALRPVALGRERLAARAERLPTPQTLLEPQSQQLDELAERLRRGLADRAGRARERLAHSAGGLRPQVLRQRVAHAARDLAQARLEPALLQGRTVRAGERLDALARVHATLSPLRPLERGFALVTAGDGTVRTSAAAAGREAALTLRFADGTLDVGTGAVPPRPRKRQSVAKPVGNTQPKLL